MKSNRKNDIKLSIVIPAYNEENNIETTIEEILNNIDALSFIHHYQIIVVDDHSSDNTFNAVKEINNPDIVCLRLSRRSGSFMALRCGFSEATGDVTLCISADGQDDPSTLSEMLEKWMNGSKTIWALRMSRKDEAPYIRLPAKLFYVILNLLMGKTDNSIDLSRADFCLLDRIVVQAINLCSERNTSLFGLIDWLGFKKDFVEYERRQRLSGQSKWSFRTRFDFAKDWIIAFSTLPLKLMAPIGFLIAMLGFLYAIFVFINAINGEEVSGWSSLMVVLLLLGGIQMVMFGVLGEYLGRNLDESRNRPLYFLERTTRDEKID